MTITVTNKFGEKLSFVVSGVAEQTDGQVIVFDSRQVTMLQILPGEDCKIELLE